MLTRLAIAGSIEMYQRHVSPLKGFCCALRQVRGAHSCSEFARRAVLRVGPVSAYQLIKRRFVRCRQAYTSLAEQAEPNKPQEQAPNDPFAKPCSKDASSACVIGCCPWP